MPLMVSDGSKLFFLFTKLSSSVDFINNKICAGKINSKDIFDFSLLPCIIKSNLSSFSIFINLYDSGG